MKIIQIVILTFLLVGCANNLTKEGEKVRVFSGDQRSERCEFIKLISVEVNLGPNKSGSALQKALNETAAVGGNEFFIINNDIHWFDGASVTGEALKCKNI
ncbi:hypothetical protein A8139_17645 [Marinomonas primoryensis]|jgi:hypothetical protein|uniref:DUF4156 domain-containing protein n=1 Tax=Marinomonas primoryensis TaxID=178399 RepID=A0A2Z4PX11_9GAMM|nr:hypothetical protein [Marinomonas primoryensis]AWY01584.1 hypothetical protein A8139_17645 [Marinomonas primoryensis]